MKRIPGRLPVNVLAVDSYVQRGALTEFPSHADAHLIAVRHLFFPFIFLIRGKFQPQVIIQFRRNVSVSSTPCCVTLMTKPTAYYQAVTHAAENAGQFLVRPFNQVGIPAEYQRKMKEARIDKKLLWCIYLKGKGNKRCRP